MLAADRCGRAYTGLSAIIDPLGVGLAGLAEPEGIAVAELRRERTVDVRRPPRVLANRRLTGLDAEQLVGPAKLTGADCRTIVPDREAQ